MTDRAYFWPRSLASRGSHEPVPAAGYPFYQGKSMGGDTSGDGRAALRGASADVETWAEPGAGPGAAGWGRGSVPPYFCNADNDFDHTGQYRGAAGPIAVRRVPRDQWDEFAGAGARILENPNENLPSITIGERVADLSRQR
jgi:hypothetical protein